MDYDTIAALFLTPSGDEPAPPELQPSSARRLRDAVEPIATIGWWSRSSGEQATALGHDFFDAYVWGRAAALGADVAPAVVVAAFGVFNGHFLGPVYEHARTVSGRDEILDARSHGATQGLQAATGDIALDVIAEAGELLLPAVLEVEPGPRPLFGALRSLPVPDDPYGRLWRAAELVREHRGDTHLGACAAAGLDMAEMNVLTEIWLNYPLGEYSATRGFDTDALSGAARRLQARGWLDADNDLTTVGRDTRQAIEDATDAGQQPLIQSLGDGTDRVIELSTKVADAVLGNRAAPADARKRAAG